jgi:histidyl-tRNA synthetase
MASIKPSLARGTRDFGPELMAKRKYIFSTIEKVFRMYGYQPLETPAMENLLTLTGKYGEEGDRLIFKILNSGDFLKELDSQHFNAAKASASRDIIPLISEKALRYDLTVPLARYVSMNRGSLTLPFKRYQIQPVWRADRPQKGRYREFYQCDADVIGSDSLFNEAELIQIYITVFKALGFKDFTVKLNNRKFFQPLAEALGIGPFVTAFITAIDKLDKLGREVVMTELIDLGAQPKKLHDFFEMVEQQESGNFGESLVDFCGVDAVETGMQEVAMVLRYLKALKADERHYAFDLTLARGLDYYTGIIAEVVTNEVAMGSIGGGGRYDNLTGIFGVEGLTGVGISFGAERILDVMEQLNLFPASVLESAKVLIFAFEGSGTGYAPELLNQLRSAGIASEWYVDGNKIKKAFAYAEAKHIPYLILLGESELESKTVSLKELNTGIQHQFDLPALLEFLK